MSKILVVDDDPVFLVVCRSILEAEGYQVLEAEDGGQALETMRNLREWAVAQGFTIPQTLLQLRDAVNATYNILNEDNQTRLIWS